MCPSEKKGIFYLSFFFFLHGVEGHCLYTFIKHIIIPPPQNLMTFSSHTAKELTCNIPLTVCFCNDFFFKGNINCKLICMQFNKKKIWQSESIKILHKIKNNRNSSRKEFLLFSEASCTLTMRFFLMSMIHNPFLL